MPMPPSRARLAKLSWRATATMRAARPGRGQTAAPPRRLPAPARAPASPAGTRSAAPCRGRPGAHARRSGRGRRGLAPPAPATCRRRAPARTRRPAPVPPRPGPATARRRACAANTRGSPFNASQVRQVLPAHGRQHHPPGPDHPGRAHGAAARRGLAGERPVLDAVRLGRPRRRAVAACPPRRPGNCPRTTDVAVALHHQEVRADPVEEEAVVADDHRAAGEARSAPAPAPAACPRRGRWSARRAAAGCRRGAASWPGGCGCARRRKHADLLLLVRAPEIEPRRRRPGRSPSALPSSIRSAPSVISSKTVLARPGRRGADRRRRARRWRRRRSCRRRAAPGRRSCATAWSCRCRWGRSRRRSARAAASNEQSFSRHSGSPSARNPCARPWTASTLLAQPRAGRDLDDRLAGPRSIVFAGQLLVGLDAGFVLLLTRPGATSRSTPARVAASSAAGSPPSRSLRSSSAFCSSHDE